MTAGARRLLLHLSRLGTMLAAAMVLLTAMSALPSGSDPASAVAPEGTITIDPASGPVNGTFGIELSTAPACPGDGPTGWRASVFTVPANLDLDAYTDPANVDRLTVDGNTGAPVPVAGQGSASAYVGLYKGDFTSAIEPPSPVTNAFGFPTLTLLLETPPTGTHQLVVACSLLGKVETYWASPISIFDDGGVLSYTLGGLPAVPGVPSIESIGVGDGSLTVSFAPDPADSPPATQFTATAAGGGGSVSETGGSSPIELTGLTNGTEYSVSVVATNSVGDSPPSAPRTATPRVVVATSLDLAVHPPGPLAEGDPVTFTATIDPVAATGSVQFIVDGTDFGSAVDLQSGVASLTTPDLTPGVHQIGATYSPNSADFGASTADSVELTVEGAGDGTTTTLVVTVGGHPATSAAEGQEVQMQANVVPDVSGTPVGTVEFLDGTTVLASRLVQFNAASFTTTTLAPGAHELSARFVPTDPDTWAPSASEPLTLTITEIPAVTLTLVVDPATGAEVGDDLELSVTIDPADAVGSLTFRADDIALADPVAVSGVTASFLVADVQEGTATYSVTFEPDEPLDFKPATSNFVAVEVDDPEKTPTSVLVTSPKPEVQVGDDVELFALVDPNDVAGEVQWIVGEEDRGEPVQVVYGSAKLVVDDLPVGEHTVKARFEPADEEHESSTSPDFAVAVVDGSTVSTTSSTTTSTTPPATTIAPSAEVSGQGSARGASGWLPVTGSGLLWRLTGWALVLAACGRAAVLLSRTPPVVGGRSAAA